MQEPFHAVQKADHSGVRGHECDTDITEAQNH